MSDKLQANWLKEKKGSFHHQEQVVFFLKRFAYFWFDFENQLR